MEYLITIADKLMLMLFMLSLLNSIRHGYYFAQAIVKSTEESPIKYRLTDSSLTMLGVSISYIITYILK